MKLREHCKLFLREWRLMFRLSRQYTWNLILSSFVEGIKPYIPLYYSAKIVDGLYTGVSIERLVFYVLMTVGLSFLLSLLASYLSSQKNYLENELYRSEEWAFTQKAMEMAYESIEDRETKLLLERIRKESQTGYNFWYLKVTVRRLILNVTHIIVSVSMTMSFFLLPSVSLYGKIGVIAGIAVVTAYSLFSTKKMVKLDIALMDQCVDLNVLMGKLGEIYNDYSFGMDLRLYGMSERIAKVSADMEHAYHDLSVKNNQKTLFLQMPGTAITELLRFGLYGLLVLTALAGEITVGSIAQYVSCCFLLLTAIQDSVATMELLFANNVYMSHYFSYFDIPNNMYQGSLTLEKRDDNEYYVEFRDVSFKYPNTETYALRHLNLKFKVGEKLAIVGENGSGKTTMIKLMCRLYDPTEGEILLNGVNIKKYDYKEYMAAFSVVFQDFKLFAMTLGQNVATAKEYDESRVRDCLIKSGFGDRLQKLPDGCETYLYQHYSDKGIEISGGEAQKIALARALYKNAPFIILDEPTSALDPISEYEVYSKFNQISGDKTAIYISHRLASCRFCDKIAVFADGNIVQSGSHKELLRDTAGKYYALWNAQAQYYTDK